MSKSDLACVYAALMLADDDIDITADKINTILKAANIKFVETYLPNLFSTMLSGKNVKDMLMTMGSAATSTVAAPSAAPTSAADSTAEKSKEPAKEEKKPVSDDDSDESMGFDLFG